MKVPADIDQLMWLLAESEDDAAAQEFIKRFQEFEIEFLRRRATVRGLKMANPSGPANSKKVPVFTPRQVPESRPMARPLAFGLASLGLAAFAFGSYAVVTKFVAKPIELLKATATNPGPPFSASKIPIGATEPKFVPKGNDSSRPLPLSPGDERPIREEGEDRSAYSVILEEAPLSTALQAIAAQVGITVELAPGMQEQNVSVQFEGMSPRQMLEKMGREYGFTPMYQGNDHWLIVPSMKFTDPMG